MVSDNVDIFQQPETIPLSMNTKIWKPFETNATTPKTEIETYKKTLILFGFIRKRVPDCHLRNLSYA
jgi:hypothetical protein